MIKPPGGYCSRLPGPARATWVFRTYIHPDYRLKGYHIYLMQKAFELSKQNGPAGLFGDIHYLNENRIKSHARLGFRPFKDIHCFRVFKKRFYIESQKSFWCARKTSRSSQSPWKLIKKNKLKKGVQLLREGQIIPILHRILESIPANIGQYDRFYLLQCRQFHLPATCELLDEFSWEVREASCDILNNLKTEGDINLSSIWFQLRHCSNNSNLIILRSTGRLVGIVLVKLAQQVVSPSGYVMDLCGRQCGHIFGLYVNPLFRGKGLSGLLISKAFELVKMQGVNSIFSEVHYLNKAAIAAHLRVGFRIVKDVRLIRIGNRKYFFQKSTSAVF